MFKFKKEAVPAFCRKPVFAVVEYVHRVNFYSDIEITPHAGQQEIIDAFDSGKYRVLTAGMGRRSGKGVTACLLAAAELDIPNANVLLVSCAFDNAEVNFDLIRKLVLGTHGTRGVVVDRWKDMEMVLKNGARLTVACEDNVKAKDTGPLTLLILDEAKLLNRRLFEEHLRPLLFDYAPQSRAVLLTTPVDLKDKSGDWVRKYYQRGQDGAPGYWSVELSTGSNPVIPKQELGEMEEKMSADLFRTEVGGKFPDDEVTLNIINVAKTSEMPQADRVQEILNVVAHDVASNGAVFRAIKARL